MKKDLSICIVTSGIKGPIKFGGIATAFHNLSIFLSEEGYDVSVLYVNHPYYYANDYEHWRQYYARFGVNLIPLDKEISLYGTREMQESYHIYKHLAKSPRYDLVIFHDLKGIAYYSLLAKKLQKDFKHTVFMLNAHASTKLSGYFNATPPKDRNELVKYFLEKSSLEMADLIVSPSQFYLDWMESNNIRIEDAKKTVLRNLVYPVPPEPEPGKRISPDGPVHFCFFSRLDTLKGIFVFIEAFDKLFSEKPAYAGKVRISFIGDSVTIGNKPSLEIIQDLTKPWPVKVAFETDMNTSQALEYLKLNNGIAISSTLGETSSYIILECLSYGIPTLASNLPNIRELINEDYYESHLFRAGDPHDLLRLITGVIENGIELPALKVSLATTRSRWTALMDGLIDAKAPKEEEQPAVVATAGPPLVSIIIPTFNKRGKELKEAVGSITGQTYNNMEIIIAHDGSFEISDREAMADISRLVDKSGIPFRIEYREKSYKPQNCNLAADIARGKYLCFFDDDDIAKPNMIEEFVRVAELTGADMVTDFAQNFLVDEEDGETVPWCTKKVALQNVSLALGNAFNVGFFQHYIGKANLFLKKDVFHKIGGMTVSDIKSPYIDWDLYMKVAAGGFKIELIPEELYYYRMQSNESIYYTSHGQERFDSYISRYHGHLKVLDVYRKKYPEISELLEFAHFQLSLPKVLDQPEIPARRNLKSKRKHAPKQGEPGNGLVNRIYFMLRINKSKVIRKWLRKTGEILNKLGAHFTNLSSLDK
jgi:glycosyltransferase involved in cell wall biosynthesis